MSSKTSSTSSGSSDDQNDDKLTRFCHWNKDIGVFENENSSSSISLSSDEDMDVESKLKRNCHMTEENAFYRQESTSSASSDENSVLDRKCHSDANDLFYQKAKSVTSTVSAESSLSFSSDDVEYPKYNRVCHLDFDSRRSSLTNSSISVSSDENVNLYDKLQRNCHFVQEKLHSRKESMTSSSISMSSDENMNLDEKLRRNCHFVEEEMHHRKNNNSDSQSSISLSSTENDSQKISRYCHYGKFQSKSSISSVEDSDSASSLSDADEGYVRGTKKGSRHCHCDINDLVIRKDIKSDFNDTSDMSSNVSQNGKKTRDCHPFVNELRQKPSNKHLNSTQKHYDKMMALENRNVRKDLIKLLISFDGQSNSSKKFFTLQERSNHIKKHLVKHYGENRWQVAICHGGNMSLNVMHLQSQMFSYRVNEYYYTIWLI